VIGMEIVITADGNLRCLYGEAVNLHVLGRLEIRRGSHVEPTEDGCWTADLSPVGGPTLGPFPNRSEALTAEREWLQKNWLNPPATPTQSPNPWKGETHAVDTQADP